MIFINNFSEPDLLKNMLPGVVASFSYMHISETVNATRVSHPGPLYPLVLRNSLQKARHVCEPGISLKTLNCNTLTPVIMP